MNPPPPTTTTSNRYSTSLTTAAATTTSPGGGRSNSSSTTYTTNTTMHVSEHHYHHPHPHQYNVKTSSSSASACSSASSSLSSSYLRISSQSVDRSSKQMFYASQTRGGGGVGNQEMVPSTSKSIDGCNLSSLIDNHNNTNMPSSSSSLSGIYADTDRHHQQLQQQHNLDSLHHRSAYQTFVNHSLISATVSDIYHTGHVLQATTESPDSFKSRLEENLIQWLTYGPLVVSDFNSLSLMNNNNNNNNTSNSNVKIVPDVYSGQPSTSSSSFKLNHSHQRLSSRQFKHPKWSATALVINCDTKSVEVSSAYLAVYIHTFFLHVFPSFSCLCTCAYNVVILFCCQVSCFLLFQMCAINVCEKPGSTGRLSHSSLGPGTSVYLSVFNIELCTDVQQFKRHTPLHVALKARKESKEKC
ncbi:unnamed protein product [Trichobilharzia regenti]|nr:unnamed protein product [Trichobilharzia regenti]